MKQFSHSMPSENYFSAIFLRLLFFVFFQAINFGSALGNNPLDSFINQANQLNESEQKVDLLYDIAFEYLYLYEADSALIYADSILALSEKLNYKTGLGHGNYVKILGLIEKREFYKALDYGKKALEIFETKNEPEKVTYINEQTAGIFTELNQFENASKTYLKVLEYYLEIADSASIAQVYFNLGKVASELNNAQEAASYFFKALEIFNEPLNLFWTYYHLSNAITDPKQKRKYYLKSLEYIGHIHPAKVKFITGTIQNNIGYSYALEGDTVLENLYRKKAIYFFKAALEEAIVSKDTFRLKESYINIGKTYSTLERNDSSIFFTKKGLELMNYTNEKSFWLYENGYKNLKYSYARKGDYEKALKYSDLLYEVRDSVFKKNLAQQIKENEDRFEFEKNRQQITQQKLQLTQAQNTRNQILFGSILSLFLISGFLYRFRQKKRIAEAEANRFRELDRLKSTFFSNISHELRTPLTLVAAPLSDALTEVKPSPLKNHLELAHSNTQKLLRLVNEILDLSKLEAGKVEAKLSETALLPLVRRLFYAFESIAQIRKLKLDFNTNIPKDLKVQMDSEKFEKILNNLLSNAVKFTENGGQITLNAFRENGHFQFEVIDTGTGISKEELPKVFDRFYQSTSENAPTQGGTGIGLSLAKELANLMDGDLKVQSELGKGSRFLLEIPLETAETNGVVSEKIRSEAIQLTSEENGLPTFPPILYEGQKPRILIVEDNPEMNEYLIKTLSKDYQCTPAFDGKEALRLVQNENFDLISCDVMMPNMDGFSFRKQVLQNEKFKRIPFVLLTARAMEEDKLKGLRMGVDDYLTKPFNTNELKARFHNLLSNKLERQNLQPEPEVETSKPATLEEQLLQTAENFVLKNLDNTQLRVEDLAKELNVSKRHLSRILKKHIGISPVNFILEIRLQKARQLLESRQFATVSEVRYEIGIESASYFTKKFTERFGKNPKGYLGN